MRADRLNLGLCGLLAACTVGNTGNPNTDSNSHPEGIALLRSQLMRDPTPAVSGEQLATFSRDQRAFAFDMYGQLAAGDSNLFFSPYSIATALAMTYAGAEGATKEEMASALHFSLPEPALHAAFNALDLALESRVKDVGETDQGKPTPGDGFQLSTNNAIFAQKGEDVHSAFLDVLAQNYDAGLFIAGFASEPERERMSINQWVSDRTEQRIRELLPRSSIDADTVMVLTNTIYFKGSWQTKFDPAETKPATFHAPSGDATVQMMHNAASGEYARGTGYQAVALPYLSRSVRMLLILPDEGQLAAVEGRLKQGLFDEARAALLEHLVDLHLPRFSFRAALELPNALKALGMKLAFGAADFSGIAGPPGELFIDNVYHQAFVAVDEQGTEAAAATAVVVTDESAPEQAEVTFDRPFLFFIYDDPTQQILFAGRLNTP
jgi:serpin B